MVELVDLAAPPSHPATVGASRHGGATLAHAAGADLKTVQDQLGHTSIVLTADTYTSVLMTLHFKIAEATARLVLAATLQRKIRDLAARNPGQRHRKRLRMSHAASAANADRTRPTSGASACTRSLACRRTRSVRLAGARTAAPVWSTW
jgi:hypothetical protein